MATGILLKGFYFAWMLRSNDYAATGFLGNFFGDSDSYVSPVHHLIYEGSFEPDFRMPGYAAFFFLPCLLLPMSDAMNVMIFIQFIFAGISVYLLARSAEWLTGRRRTFHIAFFLLGFSTWANTYDSTIFSESLSASILALLVFCFAGMLRKRTSGFVAGTGIAYLALVFLKPVFLPLGAVLLVLIGWRYRKAPVVAMKTVVLVLLPFLICDGIWVLRNLRLHGKFLPLNTSFFYPLAERGHEGAMLTFLHAWGGQDMPWYPHPDITWFYPPRGTRWNERDTLSRPPFPATIYTEDFNEDSLVQVRDKLSYVMLRPSFMDSENREALNQQVRASLLRYAVSVQLKNPRVYYLHAPLANLKRYLIHTGRYQHAKRDAPLSARLFEKAYEGWYVLTMLLGLAGLAGGWWLSRSKPLFLLMAFLILYIATVYPVVFRYSEMRYLVPVYPLLLVLGASVIDKTAARFYKSHS